MKKSPLFARTRQVVAHDEQLCLATVLNFLASQSSLVAASRRGPRGTRAARRTRWPPRWDGSVRRHLRRSCIRVPRRRRGRTGRNQWRSRRQAHGRRRPATSWSRSCFDARASCGGGPMTNVCSPAVPHCTSATASTLPLRRSAGEVEHRVQMTRVTPVTSCFRQYCGRVSSSARYPLREIQSRCVARYASIRKPPRAPTLHVWLQSQRGRHRHCTVALTGLDNALARPRAHRSTQGCR